MQKNLFLELIFRSQPFFAMVQAGSSLALFSKSWKILYFYWNIIKILEESVFHFLCVENHWFFGKGSLGFGPRVVSSGVSAAKQISQIPVEK